MATQPHDEYPLGDFKTKRELHIYHVYNDADFAEAVRGLNSEFGILTGKNGHKGTAEAIGKRYKAITDRFAVTGKDIDFFMGELHRMGGANKDRHHQIMYHRQEGLFKAEFDPEITKGEFNEMWQYTQAIKRRLTGNKTAKRKPPENDQLIYAVFKARRQYNFRQIFDLYRNGKLAGYAGSGTQFSDQESLERYYNKYKP
jgi:hypothetical protein